MPLFPLIFGSLMDFFNSDIQQVPALPRIEGNIDSQEVPELPMIEGDIVTQQASELTRIEGV